MIRITAIEAIDVRYPTSRMLDGSDAMNPDPDYSAAYAIVRTNVDGLDGHGLTFTIGRGNELCVAAINALAPLVVGATLEELTSNMAGLSRRLLGDSQIRWVGPEKGVVHLAAAAVINAVWDLWGKHAGKPVWQLVTDLEPEALLAALDLRHITDAIAPGEALDLLKDRARGKAQRRANLERDGYPAYTTSAGWLGYPDDKILRLTGQARAAGWNAIKIKVGRSLDDDLRRCALIRDALGPDGRLMVDANQVWEVDQAIEWIRALAQFDLWWVEEPVHPDDILGHRRIIEAVDSVRIATGEHCANRVMFKQFLMAEAIDVVQADGCRLAGLSEAMAVSLLAAKYNRPVCPHAGGVGLCEIAQHISMIDYLCFSASWEERMTEHAAHLHEHFVDPIRIEKGRYRAPHVPGISLEMKPASITAHSYPNGSVWAH
jgi:L-fuconate dehydratase